MENDILVFKKEANEHLESTPLGNGRIGCLVFGNTRRERIIFNEDTIWSGFYRDTRKQKANFYLEKVRKLLADNKNDEAQNIIEEHMLGNGYSESYMPAAELNIDFSDRLSADVKNYSRKLSMSSGSVNVTYDTKNGRCEETAFVSYPDEVFVLNYKLNGENIAVSVGSELHHNAEYGTNQVILSGKCPDHVAPEYLGKTENDVDYSIGRGINYCLKIRIESDGIRKAEDDRLIISGARYLKLIAAIHNTFDTEDPERACEEDLGKAYQKKDQLLNRHVCDFSELYNRVSIRLKKERTVSYNIDELLKRKAGEKLSPELTEALFQFGRYLAICSSRQGQPGNLQGIWNWQIRPPWSSNWTTNINVEMNYWPVESCNLTELFEPFENWVRRLIPSGTQTARSYYNANGWCVHHNVDVWGITTPAMDEAHYAMWPMAGVWFCQHLYRHWQYTRDIEYLEKSFIPLCEGSVKFCLDLLVEDDDGYLLTSPSTSPENSFLLGGTKKTAVTRGSAMDITMVDELFGEYIESCKILGIENELLHRTEAAKEKLRPVCIDENGYLAEWGMPFAEYDPGHRHFSPLYGCYPGETFLGDKKIMSASEKLFKRRLQNNGCIGWSYAWAICLAARYKDRVLAEELLRKLQSFSFAYNLFSLYYSSEEFEKSRHKDGNETVGLKDGFFQIETNFGFTAAVTELLLKSTCDGVELLPCLPVDFANGQITGLRAYGDITLDILWTNGILVSAEITAGRNCADRTDILYRGKQIRVSLEPGRKYKLYYFDGDFSVQQISAKKYKLNEVMISANI